MKLNFTENTKYILYKIKRVKKRVLSGGHNVPQETIIRRYKTGVDNMSRIYLSICDYWMIFDNSEPPTSLIAEGLKKGNCTIYNHQFYNQIIKP